MVVAASLLVGAAGAVQVGYFNDNITAMSLHETNRRTPAIIEDCKTRTYWFLDDVEIAETAGKHAEGAALQPRPQRYLNAAGVYYFVSQFLRMLIVFTALLCYTAAAIEMWKFGLRLDTRLAPSERAVEETQAMVNHYTIVEIAMKGLAGALTLHFAVWGDSCLEGSNNIRLATAAVFVVGFLLLMVPRQFVEHRLMRWMVRNELRQRIGGEWPSLVLPQDARVARIVTWSFWAILGYLFLFAGILPNPLAKLW